MDDIRPSSRGIDGVARTLGADALLQRTAWILLSALLAAIALGLLGRGGPLSDVDAASPDGELTISYQRFIRYHSPDEMSVTLRAHGPETGVRLDQDYAGQVDIDSVTPEPARVIGADGALRFVFHSTPGAPLRITFQYSAQHYGPLDGWIAADKGARLPIRQFTYP